MTDVWVYDPEEIGHNLFRKMYVCEQTFLTRDWMMNIQMKFSWLDAAMPNEIMIDTWKSQVTLGFLLFFLWAASPQPWLTWNANQANLSGSDM